MNFKINDEFPQFTLPQIQVPVINIPEWDEGESPYELMQKSAHNSERQRQILEEQIEPLKEIANSAKRQADSAEQQAESAKSQAISAKDIANSAKEQAESSNKSANAAKKIASKADIKGWIAIVISVIALFFEFISNREEIITYVQSLIQQTK